MAVTSIGGTKGDDLMISQPGSATIVANAIATPAYEAFCSLLDVSLSSRVSARFHGSTRPH